MNNQHKQHWCIVGGGMLGMTLAHRLAQQGQRVTLCEAAPQLGGLASAWQLGDVYWDRHYHVTLMSDTHLRSLLEELGLEREMRWVETKTGFYSGGRLLSMSNAWEFLRFPPLNMWQRMRLGGTIFLASKLRNWRRLEKIPVEKWLRRVQLGTHPAYVQSPPERPEKGNVRVRPRRICPHPRPLRRSAARGRR